MKKIWNKERVEREAKKHGVTPLQYASVIMDLEEYLSVLSEKDRVTFMALLREWNTTRKEYPLTPSTVQ
jgi:hypothetical protein